MSFSLEEIKNAFNRYINIYIGALIPENKTYDEGYLISRIDDIALCNKQYINELCVVIIEHLKHDKIQFKLKLFNIIDTLFKNVGKDYIDKLSNYLIKPFKDCFNESNKNERILLFKIFYSWKYLVPTNILDKIRDDLKLDDFKEIFIKQNPGVIEKYDEYNNKKKLELEAMNNNFNSINNNPNSFINNNSINISKNKNGGNNNVQISNNDTINLSKSKKNKNNNNQNSGKKISIEKKFKEDSFQSNINNNIDLNLPNTSKLIKTKSKTKKSTSKNLLEKKRKLSKEKENSKDVNLSKNKIKTISNPTITNKNNSINNNLNNNPLDNLNQINLNNNNLNDIQLNSNNSNIIPLEFLIKSGINLSNLANNKTNINIPQNNNINFIQQNQQQQQQHQLMKNILYNIITNNNTLYPSSNNQNQVKPSIIEFQIYQFIQLTNVKLNANLRFFSSLAKYYNDTLEKRDFFDIKCKYEDIYNNEEYKIIKQKIDAKFFKENKNVCAICGFRTLYYNNLTEHLDIHFNINYLQMEGKILFRKIGHNRNNWISGDNNKMYKNKVGNTLGNLLYYKNMMNNNLVKINKEQEEDNEEFMYPIYEDNNGICYYCGDQLKKIFSSKYNYWFYNKVVEIQDDKKHLVHQSCYEEMIKKV